jgi:hypothetical protein
MQSAVLTQDNSWILKSSTDLTVDMKLEENNFEIDLPRVVDFCATHSGGKVYLVFVFNNAKSSIYEMPVISEKTGQVFKLVKQN